MALETQLPTGEDMMASNRQAAEEAGLQQQVMAAQPGAQGQPATSQQSQSQDQTVV
jgi:hypothetical protein